MSETLPSTTSRLRLALWTPLPPIKNGIADYSVELLGYLARDYDLDIFIDDGYQPADWLVTQYAIYPYSAFEACHRQHPFDIIIYQLGGSNHHYYMYDAIKKWPGIVVFHDLLMGQALYNFYERRYNGNKQLVRYLAEEGEQVEQAYRDLRGLRGAAFEEAVETFFNTHYLLKWVIQSSLAQIAHIETAREELLRHYGSAHPYFVEMGVQNPRIHLPVPVEKIKTQLGIPASTFVVGIFGRINKYKGHHLCIEAVHRLLEEHPDILVVIVGPFNHSEYFDQVRAMVDNYQMDQRVHFAGYLEQTEFDQVLLACDVVVNLRYPGQMQMSATLMRAIAAAKPVIISDIPEWAALPDTFCWKIAHGSGEVEMLQAYLYRLMTNPDLRNSMSQHAASYFYKNATLSHMAADYSRVIAAVTHKEIRPFARPGSLGFNKVQEPEDFSDPGLRQILREIFPYEASIDPEFPDSVENRDYWEIGMQVRSLKEFNLLTSTSKLLVLTTHSPVQPVYLQEQAGMVVVHTIDSHPIPYPQEMFDGILLDGDITRIGDLARIARLAFEIGCVLKCGGILTLTAPLLVYPPAGANEQPSSPLFSQETLRRYLIEASGLEFTDDLLIRLPGNTQHRIDAFSQEELALKPHHNGATEAGKESDIVIASEGIFASVHLTLRKTDSYVAPPHKWLKSDALVQHNAIAADLQDYPQLFKLPVQQKSAPEIRSLLRSWRAVNRKSISTTPIARSPKAIDFMIKVAVRIRNLGSAWQAQGSLNEALVQREEFLIQQVAELSSRCEKLEKELEQLLKRQEH